MKTSNYFKLYFETISSKLISTSNETLKHAAEKVIKTHNNGKKTIVVGNGGSAAMASHVSVDLTVSAGIRAINFNEADLLTCFANDFGYENWVTKALDYYADPGDLAIIISSSGTSKNQVNGSIKAKNMDLGLITLSGFSIDNPLRKLGDINLWVDSKEYNVVEMTHHIWLVAIVDFIKDNKI